MPSVLKPATQDQLRDAVAWAASSKTPLEIIGSGSKRAIGRPVEAAWQLDLGALSGITLYEPEELIIQAKAGTPLAELLEVIDRRGQCLAFDPPDLSGLLGAGGGGRGTVGGMVAANLAGPSRVKMGAVRDHFLGFQAVSGRGEAFKGGARVVKNVTGYDLPKLLAGSWGTLAVMSEVILKVLPKPETEATLVIFGLEDGDAIARLCQAMGSSCEASAAAHVPADLAGCFDLARRGGQAMAITLIRLDGVAPSVEYRMGKLRGLVAQAVPSMVIGAADSHDLWSEIRDCVPLAGSSGAVWRISVPPTEGPRVLEQLRERAQARGYYDWSGGLIWCEAGTPDDPKEEAVRAVVSTTTGHATLIRASSRVRADAQVFDPLSAGARSLSARIKAQFDPLGVLNPGRMYGA